MNNEHAEPRLVRQRQLLELVPFSPATLWRRVKDGSFPRPLKLSARVTAWRLSEVREWQANCGPRKSNQGSR